MQKVAVVTGSAKGLGQAIALALADHNFTLVIHCNKSRQGAERILTQIKKKAAGSIIVSGDLRNENDVEKIFGQIFDKLGRVDLLVNNVGNFLYKEFSETTNDEFIDVLESNVYSTLFCSRAALPQMRKQASGQIINIGAVGCERITLRKKVVPYYLAKTGVYILTKTMAWEEAKNGIHINMISPGSLETDIFKSKEFPMGRAASYNDVIKALLFLISDQAYYINGANIEVAGGFIPGMV